MHAFILVRRFQGDIIIMAVDWGKDWKISFPLIYKILSKIVTSALRITHECWTVTCVMMSGKEPACRWGQREREREIAMPDLRHRHDRAEQFCVVGVSNGSSLSTTPKWQTFGQILVTNCQTFPTFSPFRRRNIAQLLFHVLTCSILL